MITRIVERLFKPKNLTLLNRLWASDDSKGGRGTRGGFFGRRDKPTQPKPFFQSGEIEQPKESNNKTVRFLKKHELRTKEIEPQPKKQFRFRKKQTFDEGKTDPITSFFKSDPEERQEEVIKRSIFFTKSMQAPPRRVEHNSEPPEADPRIYKSLPQLNYYLRKPTLSSKFYETMTKELDKIFELFESKDWNALNALVNTYAQDAPAEEIELRLHPFLISSSASAYAEWIRSTGKTFKDISSPTLKKLYSALLDGSNPKLLKELLVHLKHHDINLSYKSIDILLSDIAKDAPLAGLDQKVNEKIDLVLDILAVQYNFNNKNAFDGNAQIYTLDEWFNKLAYLALERKVSKGKFVALFEEIFINHYHFIRLSHIHESGLFLDILEAYYFGSYVTTAKLQAICEDLLHTPDAEEGLIQLRNRLITYKIKTSKFAFPNARRLLAQFQNYFAEQQEMHVLFYFMLLGFSNQKKDIDAFMKKREILIKVAFNQYFVRELLDDPLWTIDQNLLQSRPPPPKIEFSPASTEQEEPSLNQNPQSQMGLAQEEEEVKWADIKQIVQPLRHKSPKYLGWEQRKELSSYYALLTAEIEREGNPYRRELLQSITLAKLNLEFPPEDETYQEYISSNKALRQFYEQEYQDEVLTKEQKEFQEALKKLEEEEGENDFEPLLYPSHVIDDDPTINVSQFRPQQRFLYEKFQDKVAQIQAEERSQQLFDLGGAVNTANSFKNNEARRVERGEEIVVADQFQGKTPQRHPLRTATHQQEDQESEYGQLHPELKKKMTVGGMEGEAGWKKNSSDKGRNETSSLDLEEELEESEERELCKFRKEKVRSSVRKEEHKKLPKRFEGSAGRMNDEEEEEEENQDFDGCLSQNQSITQANGKKVIVRANKEKKQTASNLMQFFKEGSNFDYIGSNSMETFEEGKEKAGKPYEVEVDETYDQKRIEGFNVKAMIKKLDKMIEKQPKRFTISRSTKTEGEHKPARKETKKQARPAATTSEDELTAEELGYEATSTRYKESSAIQGLLSDESDFQVTTSEQEFQQHESDSERIDGWNSGLRYAMEKADQQLEKVPKVAKIDLNELYRAKMEYRNMKAIKSAIKLGKLELALGLVEKVIMEPLVIDRTAKNICMVVRAFLLEQHARRPVPNLHDILDQVETAVEQLPLEFLHSVHRRTDSFDELIWNFTPPKESKFLYWRTALAMSRGEELVRMEIAGGLKQFHFELEHEQLTPRQKDQFIANNAQNWREALITELGIGHFYTDSPEEEDGVEMETPEVKGKAWWKREEEKNPDIQVFDNDQDFFTRFLKDKVFKEPHKRGGFYKQIAAEQALEKSLEEGAEQPQEEAEAAEEEAGEDAAALEAEAVALEAEAAAQEEGAAEAEGTAEAAEAEGEKPVSETVSEQPAGESVQAEAEGEQAVGQGKSAAGQGKSAAGQGEGEADLEAEKILFGEGHFNPLAGVRVRGYDFSAFLSLARRTIKPAMQEQYEQEKEYIKHVINLHSLTEDAMIEDVHYLQNKLHDYQRQVRSVTNIATFMSFGLWDHSFGIYSLDPLLARKTARRFREKFFNFRKYAGKKGSNPAVILNNEKYINVEDRLELLDHSIKVTEAMIDDLLIRRMRLFREAEATVRLEPVAAVEELILWGLNADEPMGIYLGEKIAMLTNQVISHGVALQVARYLSHRKAVPAERVDRCKEALRVVGRINRDHIYDLHQDYQHITTRKHLTEYVTHRAEQLDSSALGLLARVDPTHAHQPDTINLTASLSRGALVV